MRATPEPLFSSALPWILLTSFVFLLNYLTRSIFGPLLPALEQEFGINHATSTRMLFYLAAGYSFSLFLSRGFTSSKVRPRIMIFGALLTSGMALLALATFSSLPMLTLLFVCFGLLAGQQFNAGMSTLRSLTPPSQWSKAISVHEMGPNVCFLLGPVLAEYGSNLLGWRGLISALGWTLIAAGVVFLLIGKGGESPAAPISLTGFKKALSEPVLWLFTWTISLAVAGQFAPYSVLTLHMVDERHLSQETTAFLLSASRVGTPFAVLFGGWLTTRIGTQKTLSLAFYVYALGMLLMAQPLFIPFLVGLFAQPLFTAMVFPPLFTMLARRFPAEQPLFLSIGMPLASFAGLGLMPPILGLWGDHVSFGAGFAMMGVLVILSMPLIRKLRLDND